MGQCCGKIPTEDDVDAIRKSIEDYWISQTENARTFGSHRSGETEISPDGTVHKTSPYNPGEVIQSETFNPDGSIHYTRVNTETGVRHSYDVTPDGKIVNEHTTNQDLPKGHPDRHK